MCNGTSRRGSSSACLRSQGHYDVSKASVLPVDARLVGIKQTVLRVTQTRPRRRENRHQQRMSSNGCCKRTQVVCSM